MGHGGEVSLDQAHRGYTLATDKAGYISANPLFMKYTPDDGGYFAGQSGYGYRSIEDFVEAAAAIRAGEATARSYEGKLATAKETLLVTAVLEAGRKSLDDGGRVYQIAYDGSGQVSGLSPG